MKTLLVLTLLAVLSACAPPKATESRSDSVVTRTSPPNSKVFKLFETDELNYIYVSSQTGSVDSGIPPFKVSIKSRTSSHSCYQLDTSITDSEFVLDSLLDDATNLPSVECDQLAGTYTYSFSDTCLYPVQTLAVCGTSGNEYDIVLNKVY